jgi:hypothetical protein
VSPDARELHRVITASVRELLETARLEAQAGPVDEAQLERLIFRVAAPIVGSVASLTEAQRGALLPNIVRAGPYKGGNVRPLTLPFEGAVLSA